MTDTDSMIAAIENDPSRLDEYTEDLRDILDSDDDEARQEVAEMLHEAAVDVPDRSIVARHTDLLETTLNDEDPEVRRFGASATALVADTHPETVTGLVDALVDTFSTLHGVYERGIVIQGFGAIGDETSMSLSQYDAWFADLIRNGDDIVRKKTAGNIGNFVVDDPHEYPATVEALVAALSDRNTETKEHAMLAVALIAQEDLSALPDADQAFDAVTKLRQFRNIDTEKLDTAINLLQDALIDRQQGK